MNRFAITDWCQKRIRQMLADNGSENDTGTESCCFSRRLIDATAGTGKDTRFLCDLLEKSGGEILSMDIQEMALEKTKARLIKDGFKECPDAQRWLKSHGECLKAGDDNTGNGNKRKKNPGEDGKEDNTERIGWALLQDESDRKQVKLVLCGHEHMDKYFPAESVDLVMFNLGYLPGGDHDLATKPDTTLPALKKALTLLKTGGLLSLMIYSGGDSGFEEKEQVLAWLKELDPKRYMVLVESFYNRPNNPPLPVFVQKLG